MLRINVPLGVEKWDRVKEEFVYPELFTLELEHSLVSISKWESKWCVPFDSKKDKSSEEILDYIKCMTLTPNVDDTVYNYITQQNLDDILAYIEAPMSATIIPNYGSTSTKKKETITAELIYYWMISLNIPPDYDKWHLNKLLKLIELCSFKNNPPKRTKSQIIQDYKALNEERKKKLNTKG